MPVQFYHADIFNTPLRPPQRFPFGKHARLKSELLDHKILAPHNLRYSPKAVPEDLLRAHSPDYVDSVMLGTIDDNAMRRIGFKWDESVPARGLTSVGGCIAAARSALEDGLSGQLAGGSHHAHREFGSGFCVFNDQAVAALTLIEENHVERIAIVDLDVHQGDGTASICQSIPNIFVLSVHGEKNFPFRKYPADLDIGLPDATGDNDYLRAVEEALDRVWKFKPDIILYQAGVDPLEEDRLGRLSLTLDGLMSRDRLVLQSAKDRNIPVSMSIGGGYTDPIDTSIVAYANTYRVAREIWNWT